jgi:hypothetical protein
MRCLLEHGSYDVEQEASGTGVLQEMQQNNAMGPADIVRGGKMKPRDLFHIHMAGRVQVARLSNRYHRWLQ